MKTRNPLLLVLGAFFSLVAFLCLAPIVKGAQPNIIVSPTPEITAKQLAFKVGGVAELTSGTSSMEPLIHGKTWVVCVSFLYSQIVKGELLVYMGRPNAMKSERICILHRAVAHDKGGWIMSGDHNRYSESWDRVTPQTYLGTVVAIVKP